jgi:hypothetical protein
VRGPSFRFVSGAVLSRSRECLVQGVRKALKTTGYEAASAVEWPLQQPWRGFLYQDHGLVGKCSLCQNASGLPDSGCSKINRGGSGQVRNWVTMSFVLNYYMVRETTFWESRGPRDIFIWVILLVPQARKPLSGYLVTIAFEPNFCFVHNICDPHTG